MRPSSRATGLAAECSMVHAPQQQEEYPLSILCARFRQGFISSGWRAQVLICIDRGQGFGSRLEAREGKGEGKGEDKPQMRINLK